MAGVPPPPLPPEDDANPYAAPEVGPSPVSREAPSGEAEAIRRAHLNHEASLKAIGFLYFLSAFFLVLIGVFAVVGAMQPEAAAEVGRPLLAGLGVFYMAFGVACGVIGHGLRALKPWGRWAAVVLIGLGFLISLGSVGFTAMSNPSELGASIVGAVVGSIIPAYVLYLLLSSKGTTVFSPEYKRIIAETPHVKYRTSCIVWGFLIVLLVILVIAVIGGVVSSINR